MLQNHKTTVIAVLCAVLLSFAGKASGGEVVRAFITGGHTVYHLRSAQIDRDKSRGLVAAALDGMVMCFSRDGDLRWKNQVSHSLPLDLDVADLDGDGRDETFVASADGALYVLDHAGQLKWRFSREPPLIQVCAVTGTSRGTVILTGGIEKKLYALSAEGSVLGVVESPYVVRHIRSGDFLGARQKRAQHQRV